MNTNKKTVLFIAYDEPERLSSGSGVRPAKMLKAFEEAGCDVISLYVEQSDKSRPQAIRDTVEKIKKHRPDLCYIEAPSYPILRHADRKLIKMICEMGIPMAYFYRDFYRQFPEQFPRRKDLVGGAKECVLDVMQILTDRVLRNCDIIYVPSEQCGKYVSHSAVKTLPPAGEDRFPSLKEINYRVIYVGGMSGHYDGNLILETFHELHKRDSRYKLILVCSEAEWEKCSSPYKDEPWIELHHASGIELEPLYASACAGVSALSKKYPYSELCVSVKLFQYLSFGLPQIAANTKAAEEILVSEKIGYVAESNAKAMADAFELLFSDSEKYRKIREQLYERLVNNNLWVHRAQKVIRDLTE